MKRHPLVYLLAAALSLSTSFAFAEGCDTNAKRRVVAGSQPTANTLYAHIQHVDMGSWPDGFDEEKFTYIGDVRTKSGKTYKIGYLETSWGQACHSTNRLMIFDSKDTYLGQYGDMEDKPKIQGSVLLFPYDAKYGNALDLENGPPAKAWLDGDNPEWSPAPLAPPSPK